MHRRFRPRFLRLDNWIDRNCSRRHQILKFGHPHKPPHCSQRWLPGILRSKHSRCKMLDNAGKNYPFRGRNRELGPYLHWSTGFRFHLNFFRIITTWRIIELSFPYHNIRLQSYQPYSRGNNDLQARRISQLGDLDYSCFVFDISPVLRSLPCRLPFARSGELSHFWPVLIATFSWYHLKV